MNYPKAVLAKAKRLEQLLDRVTSGEPLEEVNAALGLDVEPEQLAGIRAKYEAGGQRWEALLDGRFGHAQKIHSGIREWLYSRKEQDETLRAPQLAQEIKAKFEVEVDPGHVNYLLRKRGLSAPVGRPDQKQPPEAETEAATPETSLENAGIFFPGGSEGRPGRDRGDRSDGGDDPG